jgi:hypothetical protein
MATANETLAKLNKLAASLGIIVGCNPTLDGEGRCKYYGDGLIVVELKCLEDERAYMHELVHCFQHIFSGEYLWDEDDLRCWARLNGIKLAESYIKHFLPYWEGVVDRKLYCDNERSWEYLPHYVQFAPSGEEVFWHLAKTLP